MSNNCTHLIDAMTKAEPRTPGQCEDCVKIGGKWVHLRGCTTCGHVGCCDSSPNKHATAHFHATQHPVMRSLEPGDDWYWCYVDEIAFTILGR